MILGEHLKNSHEKYVSSIEGEFVEITLCKADGRGQFRPTANRLRFNIKHSDKIRALIPEAEGAK